MWSCRFLSSVSRYPLYSATKIDVHRFISFKVGHKECLTKAFTKEEVRQFAEISLDRNPVHLDPEYASKTRFGRCIVHGVLLNGLVSAVCSTKLPGPGAIYLSQEMKFVSPAFVDEIVTAEVEVKDIQRHVMTLTTVVMATTRNEVLMSGEAKIMLPRRTIQDRKSADVDGD